RRERMCGWRHPIDFFEQHAARDLVTFRTRGNTSCTVDECVSDRPSCIRPLGLGLRKEYEKLSISSSEIAGERALDEDDGGSDRARCPAAGGSVAACVRAGHRPFESRAVRVRRIGRRQDRDFDVVGRITKRTEQVDGARHCELRRTETGYEIPSTN